MVKPNQSLAARSSPGNRGPEEPCYLDKYDGVKSPLMENDIDYGMIIDGMKNADH